MFCWHNWSRWVMLDTVKSNGWGHIKFYERRNCTKCGKNQIKTRTVT